MDIHYRIHDIHLEGHYMDETLSSVEGRPGYPTPELVWVSQLICIRFA